MTTYVNMLPPEDQDPFEDGQPLDEYEAELSGELGPLKELVATGVSALEDLDTIIATVGTIPNLMHRMPMYFFNALEARMAFLLDAIDRERKWRESSPEDAIKTADTCPELEVASRRVRDRAQLRALLWLKGINPDD